MSSAQETPQPTVVNPNVQPATAALSSGFNDNQMRILGVIADTVFASHTGAEADKIIASLPATTPDWQRKHVRHMVESKYTDLPNSMSLLEQQLRVSLSEANLGALGLTLTLLSTRAGTFLLTGHLSLFEDLPVTDREVILQKWATSPILLLRKAFRGFTGLTLFELYNTNDEIAKATGYPYTDPELAKEETASRRQKSYQYEFIDVKEELQLIETDVLVIGSGAGGGVAASVLSKAGHKVLVVEKGTYIPCERLSGKSAEGTSQMYESAGAVITEDGGMYILAAATFGGGTTINWSASLVPQHFVREAWAKQYGLPHFLSSKFSDSLAYVCARMGVSTGHLKHSKANLKLIEGSQNLGYHVDKIPQNTGGNQHSCGFCGHGCPYGEKQGGVVTWLRDCAENGGSFMQGTIVERILFAESPTILASNSKAFLENSTPTATRKYAVGALVRVQETGRRAVVRAGKAVVCSGGSLNTPATLLRSGLKQAHIGKNLHLHPSSFVTGWYDEPINPWEGSIMTAISNVGENRDGSHFGTKLEVIASSAATHSISATPWRSSANHKAMALRYNNSFSFVVICRDRDSGRVVIDSNGRALIDYCLSAYDAKSVLAGVIAGAKVMKAAGAVMISTAQSGVEPWEAIKGEGEVSATERFDAFLAAVQRAGIAPSWSSIGSAHQMGTCAMGTKPTNSAVDPRGRIWGTEGLYVADASVFPTASGVNPMITTMGTAHSIATFVKEDLEHQVGHTAHL